MSNKTAAFIGEPIAFRMGIKVYPPKAKDVLGNPMFSRYMSLLDVSQEDIWDKLAEKEGDIPKGAPTPFEIFMSNCTISSEIRELAEEAFLFFTHEPVKIMTEGNIVLFLNGFDEVKKIEEVRYIDETTYFDFQNCIRASIGDKEKEPPIEDEHPRVAIIKAKGRRRERIKKKKGNASSINSYQMLVALCCMELGLTPLNIGEMPYISLSPLFSASQGRERRSADIQFMAAGAGSKIQPKDWIKEIE